MKKETGLGVTKEEALEALGKMNETMGKLVSTALRKGAELEKENERLRAELAELKRSAGERPSQSPG